MKAGWARWRGIPVAFKALALCLIALVALLMLLPAPPDNTPGGVTTITMRVPVFRDTLDPLSKDQRSRPLTSITPQLPRPPVRAPEPPSSQRRTPDVARLPVQPPPAAAPGRSGALPSKSDIRTWVKSQAWEFLGGVDKQGNILYRFEVWLDAPPEIIAAIKSVSYEYDAPSATPKLRKTNTARGGFRARFGSLSCAKKISITLTMANGGTRRAVADGCRALN